MNAEERELLDEEAKVKRARHAAGQHEKLNQIGYEMRATGPITATGHHRRHVLGAKANPALTSLLNSPFGSAWALFSQPSGNQGTWNDLKKFWETMASNFHFASSQPTASRYVDLRTDEEFSYIFETMSVTPDVKQQLDRVIAEVETLEEQRDAQYAAGQYGPVGADYLIYKLSDEYKMRTHPLTGEKAFCEMRVRELQAQAGPCVGGVCPVPVYTTRLTSDLRGIHVRAADPNNDEAIKVSSNEVAHEKAATPLTVQPPRYDHHFNG